MFDPFVPCFLGGMPPQRPPWGQRGMGPPMGPPPGMRGPPPNDMGEL